MDLTDIKLLDRAQKQTHICIIGAGAAGLAAAKEVLDTPQYQSGLFTLTLFETKSKVGGVWIPSSPKENPPLSPLYDSLTTNLPHPVMQFTSFDFPPSTPVFPVASVVQKYLEDFAHEKNLIPHIDFNTTVENVDWFDSDRKWNVQIRTGNITSASQFDLVFVASGHYRVPRYPEAKGLANWLAEGRASHSAWYRCPDPNLGDIILVVGAGPSANDISSEMRTVSRTVIRSMTHPSPDMADLALKIRGRIAEYRASGEVLFEDGTIEKNIDHCILATGYQFVFPFFPTSILHSGLHPPAPPLPSSLYNSTYHLFPLARHIFPLQSRFPPASLAFLGLPIRVVPFPLMQVQARAALHAFCKPSVLNPTAEAVDIMTRYEEIRSRVGDDSVSIAKAWHALAGDDQFDYRDELHAFVDSPVRVSADIRLFYKHKDLLRKVWLELEDTGKADEWVKGVGEGSKCEWVVLLKQMLKYGGIQNEINDAKL